MHQRTSALSTVSVLALTSAFLLAACNSDKEVSTAEPAPQAVSEEADVSSQPAPGAIDQIVVNAKPKSGDAARSVATSVYGFAGGVMVAPPPRNTERYEDVDPNPVKVTADDPVSTFSVDVDTASYGVMRRYLNDGVLPPRDSVRVEEFVNYFNYAYELPEGKDQPFKPSVTVFPSPWNENTQIMHVGIKGFDIPLAERPDLNLVLLIDVSGSMQAQNKLPLLKRSMRLLVDELTENDTVSMVVYAGAAGTVLEPTKGSEKSKILAALDKLSAGGSTAGAEGIRQAYQLAEANFKEGGVNRVMLATDGDFNVGIADPERLEDFVSEKRETGVFLSVLGFGGGNYNDVMMQKMAQAGNGNAAYIDTLNEARKVLVEEAGSTLFPIAKDVKIQVEFNPARVAEYRLIGYETRILDRTDFNNDKVDAGDIGSGHTVTALYEITPAGSSARLSDPLRYGGGEEADANASDELAFLRIRYKLPEEDTSKLIERPVTQTDVLGTLRDASIDVQFSAAVAGFGQMLKAGEHIKSFDYDTLIEMAQRAKGDDPFGYRSEFIQLARLAKSAAVLPTLESPTPTASQ